MPIYCTFHAEIIYFNPIVPVVDRTSAYNGYHHRHGVGELYERVFVIAVRTVWTSCNPVGSSKHRETRSVAYYNRKHRSESQLLFTVERVLALFKKYRTT